MTHAEYEKIRRAYKALSDAQKVLKRYIGPKRRVEKKTAKAKKRTWLKPGEIDPEYGVPYGSKEWWEMAEKEADKAIKAGDVKSFDSVEELIADLRAHS